MRILHVITTLDVGGAEIHLLAQVRGQSAREHEVRVAFLKGGGALAGEFAQAGARWVGRVGTGPALIARLWPHLRWAEVVHSHLLKADAACAVLATLAGRRSALVSSKHNDEQVLLRRPVALAHAVLAKLPRRTIVLSDHVGRFFAERGGIPLARQTRVYYGLDAEPFERAARDAHGHRRALRASFGFEADDTVFLCVARFAPQKAHAVLLEAFARARLEAPEAQLRLVLVGGDPFGDGLQRAQAKSRELALDGSVVFAGIRRDVAELCAGSDVFVMSSLWEGFGLVFLEAMAARLPVLATRVSAVPEVVADEVTGLLVPPSDPASLAGGMVRLARDPALRGRLGEAGQRRVRERFGVERMVEETLAVYAELEARGAPVQARAGRGR